MDKLPKVPYLAANEVSAQIQSFWEKAPFVLNINRVVAHAESAYKNCMALGLKLLTRAELPDRLRELAILRIAHLCHADYEWTHHARIAKSLGMTEEEIQGVRDVAQADCFSQLDQTVLAFTDEITFKAKAADNTFATLKKHLSDRQVVELILSVGYWNMIARLIVNIGIDLEDKPL